MRSELRRIPNVKILFKWMMLKTGHVTKYNMWRTCGRQMDKPPLPSTITGTRSDFHTGIVCFLSFLPDELVQTQMVKRKLSVTLRQQFTEDEETLL